MEDRRDIFTSKGLESFIAQDDNFLILEELIVCYTLKYNQLLNNIGQYDKGENIVKTEKHEEYKREVIRRVKTLVSKDQDENENENIHIYFHDQSEVHRESWSYGIALGIFCPILMLREFLESGKFDYHSAIYCGLGVLVLKSAIKREAFIPNGEFYHKSKKMTYTSPFLNEALPIIAHEYTHFLQDKYTNMLSKRLNPLTEGHARLVQLEIALSLAKEYEDENILINVVKRILIELVDAYKYVGKKYRKSIHKELLPRNLEKIGIVSRYLGAHHYSIGTSVLQIAGVKHGFQNVAQMTLNSDFSYLD